MNLNKTKLREAIEGLKDYYSNEEIIEYLTEEKQRIIEQINELMDGEIDYIKSFKPKTKIVTVCFSLNGKTYDYLWTGEVEPGEVVFVETKYNDYQVAKVVSYEEKEADPNIRYKEAYPFK